MAWKTILSDCFAGEEREIDPRRVKIIEGFEVDDTRVELINGTVLVCGGDGRYRTLGNPRERWAEALEVKTGPDGSYREGEIVGYVRLHASQSPERGSSASKTVSPQKNGKPASGPRPGKGASSGGASPSERPPSGKVLAPRARKRSPGR